MIQTLSVKRRMLIIFSIIFAGEMIFSLPFHVVRFFRPTLLEAFDLTNAQLGDIFALYGIMAMLAYFPGGAIADRFSGRGLMSFSLLMTALGGIYYVQIPDKAMLAVLFGYWGVTTILLFWASMIKMTSLWGGEATQGKAFGFLDGGRGLIAAGVATVAVFILSLWLPTTQGSLNVEQQREALSAIIAFYSLMTLLAAALVLIAIPKDEFGQQQNEATATFAKNNTIDTIITVVKQPTVWLQALIVMTAYCGFKGLDYYGLYATKVLELNELAAAQLVAYSTYLRPVAAITAGIIADRLQVGRVITTGFLLLGVSYGLFLLLQPGSANASGMIQANLLFSIILVFAIRGIYFALLQKSKLPSHLTGTSVGVISVVGFTPDIFFASVAGRLLDSAPGIVGFNRLFLLLACLAMFGFMLSFVLAKRISSGKYKNPA
ncbi:MAG: MFS transporter [Algicola sp.]|nr:MFS transporter [Algicola sp.]